LKRLTILASLLCLLLLIQSVTPVAAKETWTSVKSKNFFLIGNGSEKDIRQVATKLEQFREVFTHLFKGMNFQGAVPTTVIVFKSDSSFRPFKPNATVAGYFQSGPDVNYIALTTELSGEQNPYTVIFHEYTHLLVRNTIGSAPVWLNEGLAEYYSTFTISNDQKVVLGSPIANHVYLLRDKKMLPLRTLFQVDHNSPHYNEREKQSIFYAESWALLHYLILGNKGQRVTQIAKFIQLMDRGIPMEQAFQQAFQTSFETMEKELREYISHDRYPIMTGAFERKLEFDTEMAAAPVSEAEAQAYLGDLLLHSNRTDSEKYLQKALALDPSSPLGNASLAMLRVRQGKIDEARQSLERAVASNSQNYLINYYYAFALSREGMNGAQLVTGYAPEMLARIREHLNKAITLRPDYVESYNLLVFVNLVSGSQLDESIGLLNKALSASPGRTDLMLMLAQVYMRKEDYKSAKQLLTRLSQNKSDDQVSKRAQSLLAQVEQISSYREAAEQNRAMERTNRPALTTTVSVPAPTVEEKVDPSSYLREALRKPGDGEKQVQGLLVSVQCNAKGMIFSVQAGDKILKLTAPNFESIEMVAFTTDAGSEMTCGPRKQKNPVVVCYAPGDARTKTDGVVKSIEFVPKDFKLAP
jgi:tetratricopeptide (TPR) repeat protein